MESPSLKTPESQLDVALSHLMLICPCFKQGFGLDDLQKCLRTDIIVCFMNLVLQMHMPDSCQFLYTTIYDSLYELLLLLGNLDKYLNICDQSFAMSLTYGVEMFGETILAVVICVRNQTSEPLSLLQNLLE